jgi:hypothetical protein
METDPALVPRPLVDAGAALRPGGALRGVGRGRPRRGRWWWSAVAVGVVALTVSITYGVHVHSQERHADSSLAVARAQLHRDLATLGGARSELEGLGAHSAAAGATLAATEGQLESLDSELAHAEANEFVGGVNIADLDQCLAGVERALNQISLSDPAGAASTLADVSTVCSSARPAA